MNASFGATPLGFTGGQVQVGATQALLSWSLSEGYAPRLAAPTFSVCPGSYPSAQTVSLNGPTGAKIYYTTNGLLPTSSSKEYTGPISVTASEVINAVAIEPGFTDSYVTTGNYQIAPAKTPIIDFPTGFAGASSLITANGSAQFTGSKLQLTDSARDMELAAAWYAVPVNVQKFTTDFTLQFSDASANGMTFCIQNQPSATAHPSNASYVSGGPTTLGNAAGALGYGYTPPTDLTGPTGGLLSSVALKFDLSTGSGDTTGLFTNGALPTTPDVDLSSSGVKFSSGHPLDVSLTYDGTTLAMKVTDTMTQASFSHSWPDANVSSVDIPTIVGGDTAYVGFTASTGYLTAVQDVSSWTYCDNPPCSE